jgi:hypothetical protein
VLFEKQKGEIMKNTVKKVAACSLAALGMAVGAQADVVSATYADRHVLQGDFQQTTKPDVFLASNSNGRRIGTGGAGGDQRVNVPVIEFTLPTLTGGTTISSAAFGITWDDPAISSGQSRDVVVTLMNYDVTGDFSGADFTQSASSLGNGSLAGTIVVGDISNGGTSSVSLGAPALSLLSSFYTGATPNQSSVFLRLSLDGDMDTSTEANVRYNIETVGGTTSGDLVTSLSITTIPEPATLGMFAVFGGAVMFVRRRFMM